MSGASSRIRTFRVGPKNKKIEDAASGNEPTTYAVIVETDVPLAHLLKRKGLQVAPDETMLTPEAFPWAGAGTLEKHFELFDFSFRSDYGRSGVDEEFVRDKLNYFNCQPATLLDLICFGGHLRTVYEGQWYEAKRIIALGSSTTTTQVLQKKGWFQKEILGKLRHYPELECVAGRPHDTLRLSTTEMDKDGNWPNETLFLAIAQG
jgi:hypothetical protein